MNESQIAIKGFLRKHLIEAVLTWIISPRDLQEVLISLAGDIAVNEKDFFNVLATTGSDGFLEPLDGE